MSNASTSTGESPFSASGTGRQHSSVVNTSNQNNSDSWIKKPEVIISIMGMVITGVIGFSSAYILLKDDINTNKTDISVLNEKTIHYDEELKEINTDIKKIPSLEKDLAVIQEKVSNNKQSINANKNTYNKTIQGTQKTRP